MLKTKTMKTAQDFIDDNEPVKLREWRDTMVEFARYHVEQALREASDLAETKQEEVYTGGLINGRLYETIQVIDKESILNAYPLENIKP